MRLKTFLATYLLIVLVIFASLGVVSAHLTNSQYGMVKDSSEAEFRMIAASLVKDLTVLKRRNLDSEAFQDSADALIAGYIRFYSQNQVDLRLEHQPEAIETTPQLDFTTTEDRDLVVVSGSLPESFQDYRLHYSCDITSTVAALSRIHTTLLLLALASSALSAVALYLVLRQIFKPLGVVSRASRSIAEGRYDERIPVKGNNELASMAQSFNLMASQIEEHIALLEAEAVEKQQFVDNFAHEIRTPLTSIFGYAEYLQKASLSDEEVIESTQAILNEAAYMRKVADSLLQLATLRHQGVQPQTINLSGLLDDVAQSLRALMPQPTTEVICECGVERLVGQEDLLRSLLLNLGVNALKACPATGGVIIERLAK